MYKSGDENQMILITREKIEDLREDYRVARDKDDQTALELIIAEGKRWKNALEVMENVVKLKKAREDRQLEVDATDVFST